MKTLYKVLVNGKSCHGGNMEWSLPVGETPGAWHDIEGAVRICESGFHLTSDYTQWLKVGCEIYEAEGRGEKRSKDDKTAFASARLLRGLIAKPDWWIRTEEYIGTLKSIPWCQQNDTPRKEWKLFTAPTLCAARAAAGAAAGAAARAAAWDAARAAAGAAALLSRTTLVSDLPTFDQQHHQHVLYRMDVWMRGWFLLCDVNGILYVYGVKNGVKK